MRTARRMNTDWNKHSHFAALDWACDHHDVVVVDRLGAIAAEFRFTHNAAGWSEFSEKMKPFAGIPIALETSSGPAVDQLLQRGWNIYPVNPKAAQRYRERKTPSGDKADRPDAWSLADALRTDGHGWRKLLPQEETTAILRTLCRDEISLIEQRTLLVNQLMAALREYYPAALEIFDDWTQPYAWALINQFPTPALLQSAGQRKWEKFLHTQRLWRPTTAPERLKVFATANALPASPAVVTAKSLLATSLVRVLQALEKQLDEYRKRINETFQQHPDHDVFGSLPGAGEKLAPRLLGEIGSIRELYLDADALCCEAGVSPVRYQSGQINKARIRWACNKVLRCTVHLWADCSRKYSQWAQAYYQHKRQQGMSHAAALRCLGKRWLKILWRLWQQRQAYNSNVHEQSLRDHGSWVTQLLSQTAAQTCE
jgi:transposase